MAVVPAYFSPIAFPKVSLAERFVASFWANAQEEYKFKRKQALEALDPKVRALVHKNLQDSLNETLTLKQELVDNERTRRKDILKDYLSEVGRNARNLQDSQKSVAIERMKQRGSLRKEAMSIQKENQQAFRDDPEANRIIKDSVDQYRNEQNRIDAAQWLPLFIDDNRSAASQWFASGDRYNDSLEELSKTSGRTDQRRREALFAQMQEEAFNAGDFAGANKIAAHAMGVDRLAMPTFMVGNQQRYLDQLRPSEYDAAQPVVSLDLMENYKAKYGPVTDSDIQRYQREVTQGGVGAVQMESLDELLSVAGLGQPLDLTAYDQRIQDLRTAIQRSQVQSRQESAARSAVISGTAFSPYIGRLETPTQELNLIQQLGEIYQNSPAAGNRVIKEITQGRLEPGETDSLVFEGWRQEAANARLRGLGEKEEASLGGNVFNYFKSQLRAVSRDAAAAKSATDIVDLRERLMYLSDNLDNEFVFRQLNQLETSAGTNLGSILKTGLRNISFEQSEDVQAVSKFADALADTIDTVEKGSTQSEIAWLPYQYSDEIQELSSLYQQGDRGAYKQRAVDLRNRVDILDPDLAGNAGRTIVNQVDKALEEDNFDMFHSKVTELNNSLNDWIVESQAQMTGVGE
tara:strand:+ start:392 stop:2290 length:1899 start_codon:yes stop_codon:yes gene_type:complete